LIVRRFLQSAAHLFARSAFVNRLLVRIRDLCNAVLAEGLNDGIDQDKNGEAAVVRAVAAETKVFVDVGANVGDWSALALSVMADDVRAVLVEPGLAAADRLAERFAGVDRVEIFRGAASDQVGTAAFFEGPDASEGSTLVDEPSSGAVAREVALTTVDELIRRFELDRIDFLKIDTEGHDLSVLRGARGALAAGAVRVIQFEYHKLWAHSRATLGEAWGLLNSHDYEVFRVRAGGLEVADYEPFRDYFGYSNYLAVLSSQRALIASLVID